MSNQIFEGLMAHEIKNEETRKKILKEYREKYKETPFKNPEKYNPLSPPEGWAYDPYYECWIKL